MPANTASHGDLGLAYFSLGLKGQEQEDTPGRTEGENDRSGFSEKCDLHTISVWLQKKSWSSDVFPKDLEQDLRSRRNLSIPTEEQGCEEELMWEKKNMIFCRCWQQCVNFSRAQRGFSPLTPSEWIRHGLHYLIYLKWVSMCFTNWTMLPLQTFLWLVKLNLFILLVGIVHLCVFTLLIVYYFLFASEWNV